MKHRQGFVSNSSSSSFIVGFDKVPESAEELHTMMFPEGEHTIQPYDHSASSTQVAETVFEDMTDQLKFKTARKALIADLSCIYTNEIRTNWRGLERQYKSEGMDLYDMWEKIEDDLKPLRMSLIENFLSTVEDKILFRFEYGDDDSYGALLEHGDIFRNLPHFKLSFH